MKTLKSWLVVVLVAAAPLGLLRTAEGAKFLAFSLKEAENRLRSPAGTSDEVRQLGGITHLVGVVYDPEQDELILVGEVRDGAPAIRLDDFVLCLRAEMKAGIPPVVSIDVMPDTLRTGMQVVRFEGGIENTPYGMELLVADVLLKKMGLDMLQTTVPGVVSYFTLSANHFRETGETKSIVSKVWFVPAEQSFTATRGGVSVVKELVIEAKTDFTLLDSAGSPEAERSPIRDELAEQFAEAIALEFSALSQQYQEFARLDQLFRPAALARSVRRMHEQEQEKDIAFHPTLDFWLNEHHVVAEDTPGQFPLLQRKEFVRREGTVIRMTMQGGIQLDALVADLNAGDADAFKKAVLLARPEGHRLTWPVALHNWLMRALPGKEDERSKVATDRVKDFYRNKLPATSFLKSFEPVDARDSMQQRLGNLRLIRQNDIVRPGGFALMDQLRAKAVSPTNLQLSPPSTSPQFARHAGGSHVGAAVALMNAVNTRHSASDFATSSARMNRVGTGSQFQSVQTRQFGAAASKPIAPHLDVASRAFGASQSQGLRTLTGNLAATTWRQPAITPTLPSVSGLSVSPSLPSALGRTSSFTRGTRWNTPTVGQSFTPRQQPNMQQSFHPPSHYRPPTTYHPPSHYRPPTYHPPSHYRPPPTYHPPSHYRPPTYHPPGHHR